MRKNKSAAIFAIITVALLLQTGAGMAGETSCRTNEYEIMSLLIREQYGSEFSLILIGGDTESSCPGEPLSFLKETWPKLKGETIDSLIVNYSGAPRRLAEKFSLPVEYRLMSNDEYMEILRGNSSGSETLAAGADIAAAGMEANAAIQGDAEPDWDNFDRVFPDAQGYLTFSRVAFDSECTQALVIFSNAYRCSGVRTTPQSREIACFGKKDGAWILIGISRGIRTMD
jgi:hypothetical protein